MRKIRSITDVITNSSTEVFLLETTDLKGVSEILPSITKGYLPPEILTKGFGPLEEVYSFYEGTLFDEESDLDRRIHIYMTLGTSDYYTQGLSQEFQELHELWKRYVRDHREYLTSEVIKSSGWKYFDLPDNDQCFRRLYPHIVKFIPETFLLDFLKDKELPKELEIPEKRTLGHWIGKIGFMGEDDNSIPYETWETILGTFGGTNFHLG